MRELKFRYMIKDRRTGKIATEIRTLEEFEQGLYFTNYPDARYYELISKDQFIERSDKDGKEIYEGDIIQNAAQVTIFRKGVVYYDKTTASFQVRVNEKTSMDVTFFDEVIGNTIENPELLKGEKQ